MAKVLALVSFKIFPAHMGGQKGVAMFYQYLSAHDEVVMAASNDHYEPFEAPFPVQTILNPNRRMPANVFRLGELKNIVRKEKVNVIVAEHSYTAWLAYLLKRATGIPFIIHSHNLEAYRFRQMERSWWKLYNRYEKWIHQKTSSWD
jgi:polysaccharide biosynthesis protein PslH